MLPDGFLIRLRNMRLDKDARWICRQDFDQFATSTAGGLAALVATDLHTLDGRLLAAGDDRSGAFYPAGLFDLVAHVDTWRSDPPGASGRLSLVNHVRNIGRLGPLADNTSINTIDGAVLPDGTTAPLACLAYNYGGTIYFHIFRTTTDATILRGQVGITSESPRVVAVGDSFFIIGVTGAGAVECTRYNATTGVSTIFQIAAAGAAISAIDARVNFAGNGFHVAVHRAGPTTQIHPVTSGGVVGGTITGPATAFNFVTVIESSTRVNLVAVLAAGGVNLYSYLAGVLNPGAPTNVFPGRTTASQAGACLSTTGDISIVIQRSDGANNGSILKEVRTTATHVLATSQEVWPFSQNDVLVSKPLSHPNDLQGTTVFAGALPGLGKLSNFLGVLGQQALGAVKEQFAGGRSSVGNLTQITYDPTTDRYYVPQYTTDIYGVTSPLMCEFSLGSTVRRQSVEMGGELYIAGGMVQVYDGHLLAENGFPDCPTIISATPSAGVGSLPSNTVLNFVATWEWRDSKGYFVTSRPSLVTQVTMGGADDTVTLIATAPHTIRRNVTSANVDTVRLVIWRSTAGVAQLRRAASVAIQGIGTIALPITTIILDSDTVVRAREVIYTQAGRGVLGAIQPHESPDPCQYICRLGERLLAAGGPDPFRAQVSKRSFPGETVTWSGASGFYVNGCQSAINGVGSIGKRGILFTRERIYQFFGEGPDDDGAGQYDDAQEIGGSIGLLDWRSILLTPLGLMFQGTDGQLWNLPTDGGPPFAMHQVQDTLRAFPTVVAAVMGVDQQLATFCCTNGVDSRLVSLDLRTQTWIVDDFATSTVLVAAGTRNGRLVYVTSAGLIFQEKEAGAAPNTFIEHGFATGDIKPYEWQQLVSFDWLGEMLGNAQLRARISYDNGLTFTTMSAVKVIATPAATIGQALKFNWAPLLRKCDRFRLEFTAITNGTATAGLAHNQFNVNLIGASGPKRLSASQRG